MNLFSRGDKSNEPKPSDKAPDAKAPDIKSAEVKPAETKPAMGAQNAQNIAGAKAEPLKAASPAAAPSLATAPVSQTPLADAAKPASVAAPAPTPVMPSPAPVAAAPIRSVTTPTPTKAGASMGSVISKALKITGELESTEDIQIDGTIDGDVRGVGVKIGQNARVKGTVYGEEVELAGTVEGRIESKKVTLSGTARMTGDVFHQDIKIESGAYINGSLKPEMGKPESKAETKTASKGQAAIITPAPKDTATATAH